MDVIDAYLDAMFNPYPATPRLAEARAELRQMMEDGYQAALERGASHSQAVGEVISEFGSLDEVADTLGIADELGTPAPEPGQSARPPVTVEQAQAYEAALGGSARWMLAGGVALFILSPIPLIVLASAMDQSALAAFVGIATLVVFVAAGVTLLVVRSSRLAACAWITRGEFGPSPQAVAWAEQRVRQAAPRRAVTSAAAIVLWILAALPVVGGGLLAEALGYGWVASLGVASALLMVAAGVVIWIQGGAASAVLTRLREPGVPAGEETASPVANAILGAYWPLVTAAYLAWSFIADAWDRSWMIWPIAAVAYAAITAVVKAVVHNGQRE